MKLCDHRRVRSRLRMHTALSVLRPVSRSSSVRSLPVPSVAAATSAEHLCGCDSTATSATSSLPHSRPPAHTSSLLNAMPASCVSSGSSGSSPTTHSSPPLDAAASTNPVRSALHRRPHSAVQKQVLSLYRSFLRAARTKGAQRANFEALVKSQFEQDKRLSKTDFRRIEYLLRRGHRQLQIFQDPQSKAVLASSRASPPSSVET